MNVTHTVTHTHTNTHTHTHTSLPQTNRRETYHGLGKVHPGRGASKVLFDSGVVSKGQFVALHQEEEVCKLPCLKLLRAGGIAGCGGTEKCLHTHTHTHTHTTHTYSAMHTTKNMIHFINLLSCSGLMYVNIL